MLNNLVHSRKRATSNASKSLQTSSRAPGSLSSGDGGHDAGDDDTTVVEPEQGNGTVQFSPPLLQDCYPVFLFTVLTELAAVLMHIIQQLRPGADLSRVVLPTFILEPRSMLERITK